LLKIKKILEGKH